MSLSFPTTNLKTPSGLTAIPSGLKRPAFGTLYGFDAQGGGGGGASFSNTYSLAFDGTDDNVSVPADASLNTTGDVSFSAWFYADNLTSYKAIAAKRDDAGTDWQFAVSSGVLTLYLPWGVTTNGSTTLSTGQWYHVAFTVDVGVTDGIKLYVNGSAESNTGTASASGSNLSVGLKIGWNNVAGRYWNGKIDEVAWFHSALSASDITAIYNSGGPADLTAYSPVGWWRMGDNDSGTGTTITDQGSGGNDATLVNGPTYSTDVPSAPTPMTDADQLAYPGGLWTSSDYAVSVQPLFHFDGSILDGASADNNPSNGTAVSTWGDRSGQSTDHDASQATASAQPSFEGTYLDFDGAASPDYFSIANPVSNVNGTAWTLCMVAYKAGSALYDTFAPMGRADLVNASYVSPLNHFNGVTYFLSGNASVSTAGYGPHFDSIQQFVTKKDTSNDVEYFLQGGNSYKTLNQGAAITNLFGTIGNNGHYHKGRIYEIILWGSELSTADLNVVRTYFNNKYTDLPSSTAFS